jgi:hypothetical protein
MSYCRFGPDSDVYVYSNLDGKVECCWCALSETRETVPLTREEMLAHLWDHEQAGHKVPDYATLRLRGEIADPPRVDEVRPGTYRNVWPGDYR